MKASVAGVAGAVAGAGAGAVAVAVAVADAAWAAWAAKAARAAQRLQRGMRRLRGLRGLRTLPSPLGWRARRARWPRQTWLALVLLPLALGPGVATATEWSARLPGGAELAIVEDPSSTSSPYRLERRQGGAGTLDRQFGQGGSVALQLGGETGHPSGLRVDAQGRILVFGQVTPGRSIRMPVLQRFDASGAADRHWAAGGRAQLSQFGSDLAPEDVLPLADGRLLVVGGSQGRPDRAVLWRMTADGRLDTGFGVGGWLALRQDQASQGVSLAAAGSAVLIGVQVTQDNGLLLEVHRWDPEQAADPVLVARQAMPEHWAGLPVLEPRQDRCGWLAGADSGGAQRGWLPCQMLPTPQAVAWRVGPAPAAAAVAEAAAASRAATEGSVGFSPYAPGTGAAPVAAPLAASAPAAAASAPAAEDESGAWVGWLVAAALVGAGIWWRLARRRGG